MPKIFLTGSGNSRGYVTGSGNLNNPARYLAQQRDNERIEYPTIKRMNSNNASGEYSIFFNDENAENNSSVLIDDFKVKDNQDYTNNSPDSSKWVYSTGVYIKQEFDGIDDKITDGALVLGGPGDSNERYISSIKKISNPTLNMTVLIGPYNVESTALSAFKLKLVKPTLGSRLKLQISEDNSSWHDVPISKENLNINSSYGESYAQKFLSSEGYLKHPSVRILTSNISQTKSTTLPVLNIKIEKEKFSSILPNTMFYIRLVETGYNTSVADGSWAIGNINILSRDKSVIRPGSLVNSKFLYSLHADPSYLDDNLIYNYGIAKNLNLNQSPNIQQQSLKPFLDNLSPTNNDSFYNEGISNNLYPGFDDHLFDKTKFEIDLSPVEQTRFGYNQILNNANANAFGGTPDGSYDIEGHGQILMVYWNNILKKWEKIGQPFQRNFSKINPDTISFLNHHTGTCIGFSGLNYIFEGVGNTFNNYSLLNETQIAQSNITTDTWDFPYGPQYHASSSQSIKAKDIGINKPFLVEKISIESDANFEFPKYDVTNDTSTFKLSSPLSIDLPSSTLTSVSTLQICTPTFFILKQKKDIFKKNKTIESQLYDYASNSYLESTINYEVNIPSYSHLVSGTNPTDENLVYVEDSRELLTYAQSRIFVTASWATDATSTPPLINSTIKNTRYSVQEIIDGGLRSDFDIIRTRPDHTTVYSLTESLKINSKVINTNKQDKFSLYACNINGDVDKYYTDSRVYISKSNSTNNHSELSSNRNIINGNTSTRLSNQKFYTPMAVGDPVLSESFASSIDSIKQHSPYVIFPNDDLIFGWQYPFYSQYNVWPNHPGSVGSNDMTLLGNSKLVLYGSQIKNGKEFHEGLNQNLVTNNVHEVIGNEPVIDQWQINEKESFYLGFADRFPFLDFLYGSHLNAGNIVISNQNYLLSKDYRHGILGKVILTPESNIILYRSSDLSWSYNKDKTINIHQTYKNSIDKPWMRITGHTYWSFYDSKDIVYEKGQRPLPSLPAATLYDAYTLSGELLLFEDSLEGKVKKVYSTLEQTVDNPIVISYGYGGTTIVNITKTYKLSSILKNQFNLTDALRVYSDAKSFYGDYLNNSWFGTQRSYFDTTKSLRSSGSPKYYFNSRGYGQFSHFEQQGKDSKFNSVVIGTRLSSTSQSQVVGSPVVCKFVELQYFQDTSGRYKKNYKKISVEEIDGTSDSSTGFQSSNLSNNMTIVAPFYDDGIALNRSYGEKTVTIDVPSVPSLSSLTLPSL